MRGEQPWTAQLLVGDESKGLRLEKLAKAARGRGLLPHGGRAFRAGGSQRAASGVGGRLRRLPVARKARALAAARLGLALWLGHAMRRLGCARVARCRRFWTGGFRRRGRGRGKGQGGQHAGACRDRAKAHERPPPVESHEWHRGPENGAKWAKLGKSQYKCPTP